MATKIVYAEDMPYWKSSKSDIDTWLEKVKTEIKKAGGKIVSSMYGDDHLGRSAFMIMFQFDEDTFRMVWPILQSKRGELRAAKIQAVTMMYHAVKAKATEVRVRGARAAFFADLMLPGGQTAAEASNEQFLNSLPALLPARTD